MMKFKINETIQDVHINLASNVEMAKDDGKKLVGGLCSYSPAELIIRDSPQSDTEQLRFWIHASMEQIMGGD